MQSTNLGQQLAYQQTRSNHQQESQAYLGTKHSYRTFDQQRI
jgi:hypothetical protein